jgi:hypothetical protein
MCLNKHQEDWQLNNKQVADKIYKKKKTGKNTTRTFKGSYLPYHPLIEEAPEREPSSLRI